jgi:hypothetical protein
MECYPCIYTYSWIGVSSIEGNMNPTGLQYIVDELLHTVIPLFMLGYWFLPQKR